MEKLLLAGLLVFFAFTAQAQTDSASFVKKSQTDNSTAHFNPIPGILSHASNLSDTLKNPVSFPDSLHVTSEIELHWKSAKHKLDSIGALKSKLTGKIDSLERKALSPVNKLNGEIQKIENKVRRPVDGIEQKINDGAKSVERNIQHPIDSIQQKLNTEIQSIQKDIQNPVTNIENSFNSNVKSLTQGANLPGGQLGSTSLNTPAAGDVSLDTKGLLQDQPKLPGVEGNLNINRPGNKLPGTSELGEGNSKANPGLQLPKSKANEMPGLKEMNELNSGISKIGSKITELEKLEGDAKKIANGKAGEVEQLPKELENRAIKLTHASELQTQAAKFTAQQQQYEALVQKYKDKKLLEQELKSKSSTVANQYLNQNVPVVKDAQVRMTKAKKMYGSFQSIKNLPKHRPNEMKGKPFYERLVPGVNAQIYQSPQLIVDIAPALGYRITGHWTAGISGVYRVGINKQYKYYLNDEGVWGWRLYGQFLVSKGFFLHGEWESLNLNLQKVNPMPEPLKSHVYGGYVGIGKKYTVSKKWTGSLMALYRYQYDGILPHQSKFNIRLGFTFVTKKVPRLAKMLEQQKRP